MIDAKHDRARGALLGLAVGDSAGVHNEFRRLAAPPFPRLARGPVTGPVGGGPFHLASGQISDDTQMACCLALSLSGKGRFDLTDVAARYVAWTDVAFDIGNQTRAALSLVKRASPEDAGKRVWISSKQSAAGNGSLMRCAPIGVFFAEDPEQRRLASLADSALTHFDPRCQLACAALNAAISTAIVWKGQPTADALVAAGDREVDAAAEMLVHRVYQDDIPLVVRAAAELHHDLRAARDDDPKLYGPELHLHDQMGFVRIALRGAFWELLHAPTFEAAVIDTINRFSDSDTVGAVVGALAGAYYGESAIPEEWKTSVLGALQDGPPSPLRDLYHPTKLLELVP